MASPLERKTSWKDRLAKTFGSAEKDREKNKDTKLEQKEEEWCFVDGPAMETAFTERGSPDSRKKPPRAVSSSVVGGKGPASGNPSSGRVSKAERLPRPGSPNPTGIRRSSASRSRLEVQGQQNGGKASPRSVSPVRSNLKKKSSMSSSPTPRPDTNSDLPPVQQTHLKQNGKVTDSPPATFSKIRDTLRISKPKRKKGGPRSVPYSVYQYSAPEINLSQPSKYKDPFEVSYTDSTEEPRLGQGHDFKPVSIPHNKPEYCDHCGETAWGLYRQVLKCPKCDFICHRKCEAKVIIDCATRLEQAVLQHDKQVEETAHTPAEEETDKDTREEPEQQIVPILRTSSASSGSSPATTEHTSDHMASGGGGTHHSSQVLLTEKMKMIKKIRDYNRKTTPVHHIHIKSTRDHHNVIEYQGFVRVHMCVQRPIHVSTAITRTSWYRLMRPVKERSNSDVDAGFETAFYLPTDTNRLVHIHNATSTKELIQILLKKFCVTDNPKKFSLYEEYGSDARRLFEEDSPLTVVLEASCAHRNSKLVLRDNTYSTIQWDAFTLPELSNFIQILHREEDIYAEKLEERFKLWRNCISQVMKANCMDSVSRQTKMNVMAASSQPGSRLPKNKKKVESAV